MTDKSKLRIKLVCKIIGMLLILAGATLVIVGFTDFFTALTKGAEPKLFLCSFLGIPTFFLGVVATLYGFIRKVNLQITKESIDNNNNLHKVTVTHSIDNDVDLQSKKICSSCKRENDSDSSFCKHCGTKL